MSQTELEPLVIVREDLLWDSYESDHTGMNRIASMLGLPLIEARARYVDFCKQHGCGHAARLRYAGNLFPGMSDRDFEEKVRGWVQRGIESGARHCDWWDRWLEANPLNEE